MYIGLTIDVHINHCTSIGHATQYVTPQPSWSAFRDGTQYGYGELTLDNSSCMTWEWHRNRDGELVSTDTLTIYNSILL